MPPIKNKICLLIPFFGQWPSYVQFFTQSISLSKLIDVVLITDLPVVPQSGSNISYVRMSFEELKGLAERKLGINIALDNYYKLCDFKPAYGIIFEELIQGYSHWAYGDIDLVYGWDLDYFVEDWQTYEVLTFREDWLTGSLTILQNTPKVNVLYQKSSTFKYAFTNPNHVSFGECYKIFSKIRRKGPDAILEHDDKQSFTWVVRNEELNNDLKVFRKGIIKEFIPWLDFVFYDKGALIQRDGTQLLYYHFVSEKESPGFAFPKWKEAPAVYWIDRYGFWTYSFGLLSRNAPSSRSAIFMILRQYSIAARNRCKHALQYLKQKFS